MIATTQCLPYETLRRYSLGEYSDDEGDRIEAHLSECVSCGQTLAQFDDTGDSLVRHLPLTGRRGHGEENEDTGWLKRLMSYPPDEPSATVPPSKVSEGNRCESTFGAYELSGVLGKGGMGVVYAARHRQLGRPVAIKVVNPRLVAAKEAQRRFDREIQVLGALNHPGIVSATDAGRIAGAAYLVMERIDGADLASIVRGCGPLSISEACEITRQVAFALAAAHQAGAIHRDVKPSNVMINRAGTVKLLDFGLAHLAGSIGSHPETSLGRLLGTLDYMAPEQAGGDEIGPAADLYGLGATLFFLLTGRPPKVPDRNQNLVSRLRSLTEDSAPSLADIRSGVPIELNDLVASLLNSDPANRPASVAQVAAELSAWTGESADESLVELAATVATPNQEADGSDKVVQSLSGLLGPGMAKSIRTDSGDAGSRNRQWWIFGGMAAAAALMLGIVIIIESGKGTLRIETNSDNPVPIRVVQGNETVDQLTVTSAGATTRLRAGEYTVEIDGQVDGWEVADSQVTLTRGGDRIVTVRELTPPAVDSQAVAAGTADKSDGVIIWKDPETVALGPSVIKRFHFSEKQVRQINDLLTKTWHRYIALELKHSTVSVKEDGQKQVTVSPFIREQHALDDEFWTKLDAIVAEEHRLPLRRAVRTMQGRPPTEVQDEDVLPNLIGWQTDQYPVWFQFQRKGTVVRWSAQSQTHGLLGITDIAPPPQITHLWQKALGDNEQTVTAYVTASGGIRIDNESVPPDEMATKLQSLRKDDATLKFDVVAHRSAKSSVVSQVVSLIRSEFGDETSVNIRVAEKPERLFKGETESAWQRRFDAETNPVSKIEAGKALIALSESRPDSSRVKRILDLGGALLLDGCGDSCGDLAVSLVSTRRSALPRWPDSMQSTWKSYLEFVAKQCHTIDPIELVQTQIGDDCNSLGCPSLTSGDSRCVATSRL